MKNTYSIILVFSFAVGVLCGFPSSIKKCKRNDPQLDDCIKNTIFSSGKYTTDEVEKLYSTISTDIFTNIKINSGDGPDVTHFKIDLDNPTIWLNVTFPSLELDCNYTGDGKFINITFHGDGKMIANFTNTNVTVTLHGGKVKRNGQDYISWESAEAEILEDSLQYFYLADLFKGNPELTVTLRNVGREDQHEITKTLIPAVADILGQAFLASFNEPFKKVSLNDFID